MAAPLLGWHFVGPTLRGGRPVPADGEPLRHKGRIIPCKAGLHISERLIDALRYAPGSTICRAELRGERHPHSGDKWAGRERVILWRVDGESLLREFARWCALQVIHLWPAPDDVRRYLETGDEALRAAAMDAAMDAAYATADAATATTTVDAARAKQNEHITALVMAAHQKETHR